MSEASLPADRVEHEGVVYLLGSAGSLILSCRQCGNDRFRDAFDYFHRLSVGGGDERCWCGTRMEPVRLDELTVWEPLWKSADEPV